MSATAKLGILLFLASCSSSYVESYQPYEVISEKLESYPLPKLNYNYNELEPFIDEATMKVHHTGHHGAYTKKMNSALKEWKESGKSSELASQSIMNIIKSVEEIPEKWKNAIRNNGGGYLNHAIFFSMISPNPEKSERLPKGKVFQQIFLSFRNFSSFKEIFTDAALKLFGSGYLWLCREPRNNALTIFPTDNQQCPLTYGLQPILVIDVWEHAYYLKHKNKRANYIADWWRVVDWKNVEEIYNFWETKPIHTEL